MLYIFNLFFSCFYLYMINEKNAFAFLVKIIPVIFIWVFIVGGQDNIGTDYLNYYSFFQYPSFDSRFEPLFKYISILIHDINRNPQIQFFVYALINACVIFYASHRAGVRHWALFYFLLVTVSTFFNNQMNGIRQCCAVVFVYWAFIEFYTSKIKGITLIIVACGFHYSSMIGLLFLFIKKTTEILTKRPKLLLLITLIVSILPSTDNLNVYVIQYLPDFLRENTSYESMYSGNDDYSAGTGIIYKVSKLILIPVYWMSLKLLDTDKLSEKETFLFKFGLLSYSLRCLFLVNNLLGRFSYFFWIPSLFPIYYLCIMYWKEKKQMWLILLLVYSSIVYFVKVAIGMAEYKSSFIYF